MSPSDITRVLKEQLEGEEDVCALVLVGSQARESVYTATAFSDLEAYVIVKDGKTQEVEKKLLKVIDTFGTVLFWYQNPWSGFSVLLDTFFRIELPLVAVSDIPSVFTRPKAQEVKVLLDRTDGTLQTALMNRPSSIDLQNLFHENIHHFWYMAVTGIQYYKKGEIWNARSVLQILCSSLIKFYEFSNDPNILLLETNKRIEQFLTSEQLEFLKKVSPSYQEKEIHEAFVTIVDLFFEVTEMVAEKNKFVYNKQIPERASQYIKDSFVSS